MDGDRQHIKKFEELRLYNFARLLVKINLFVRSGNIYKYKFLEHLKKYYYYAVNVEDQTGLSNINKIKEIEIYTYRQLFKFMFGDIENRDKLFYQYGLKWIVEIIQTDSYRGLLPKHTLISILLEEALDIANDDTEHVFAKTLSVYYRELNESEVPEELKLNAIKNRIEENRRSIANQFEIEKEELFKNEFSEDSFLVI
ncbi:hypothetical protein [Peribacillus asahii]|uniref:hypothetical protein n=1 Tax=Peribacillus asahii TaxID=228899 RepID=UPI00207AAB6D|nr:hypothetical protein [Peribacillus asahii]USK59564.1 hypothetical protein LIT37_20780 [Peribacillus asahii]